MLQIRLLKFFIFITSRTLGIGQNGACAPVREYALPFSLRTEAFCEGLDYTAED